MLNASGLLFFLRQGIPQQGKIIDIPLSSRRHRIHPIINVLDGRPRIRQLDSIAIPIGNTLGVLQPRVIPALVLEQLGLDIVQVGWLLLELLLADGSLDDWVVGGQQVFAAGVRVREAAAVDARTRSQLLGNSV